MKPRSKFKSLWNFFNGHIRCINLTSREDRYRDSKKVFTKHNIPVNYYRTTKHPRGGEWGCFESHINIITQAYNEGAERVLIFEDDVTATEHLNPTNLAKAIKFMEREKWDIFYLGALPNIKMKTAHRTKYPDIYKLRGICTHAYIVNRPAMKRLIGLEYNGVPIDYYYIHNFNRCYAFYPTMFLQGLSSSDIQDGGNWWSSYASPSTVSTFYRCVEWYAYYVNYPLYMLIPLIGLVVAWYLTGMDERYSPICLAALILAIFLFGVGTWDV